MKFQSIFTTVLFATAAFSSIASVDAKKDGGKVENNIGGSKEIKDEKTSEVTEVAEPEVSETEATESNPSRDNAVGDFEMDDEDLENLTIETASSEQWGKLAAISYTKVDDIVPGLPNPNELPTDPNDLNPFGTIFPAGYEIFNSIADFIVDIINTTFQNAIPDPLDLGIDGDIEVGPFDFPLGICTGELFFAFGLNPITGLSNFQIETLELSEDSGIDIGIFEATTWKAVLAFRATYAEEAIEFGFTSEFNTEICGVRNERASAGNFSITGPVIDFTVELNGKIAFVGLKATVDEVTFQDMTLNHTSTGISLSDDVYNPEQSEKFAAYVGAEIEKAYTKDMEIPLANQLEKDLSAIFDEVTPLVFKGFN